MIKALLVELLKAYILKEEKSYSRYFTYIFAIIGLILLISANYLYFYFENREVGNLIALSAASFIFSFTIESFVCYFEQRAKYRTLAPIKSKCNELVAFMNEQIGKLITIKTLTSYLPVVVRFMPIGIMLFAIRAVVKKKLSIK